MTNNTELRALAYKVANAKLGEGPDVRCEGPTEFEIETAGKWVRRVLAALTPSAGGEVLDALTEAEAGLSAMIRLSDMGTKEALKEPEEDGCFASYNRAVKARDRIRQHLASLTPSPVGETIGEHHRYHFMDESPVSVETVDGEIKLGKGWLAITESEYRALTTPSPDRQATFELSDEELKAVREIGADQELSDAAVIRQALRHYQLLHVRLKAGETFHFSGDAQRAAEFAGLVTTSPEGDRITDAMVEAGARELYRVTTADPRVRWEQLAEWQRDEHRGDARACLTAALNFEGVRIRREALEEAAGVADGLVDQFGGAAATMSQSAAAAADAGRDIAEAIRALIPNNGEGGR